MKICNRFDKIDVTNTQQKYCCNGTKQIMKKLKIKKKEKNNFMFNLFYLRTSTCFSEKSEMLNENLQPF